MRPPADAKESRRSVSRVLSAPLRALYGHSSGACVATDLDATNPGGGPETPAFMFSHNAGRPYSVLLPVGFAVPGLLPAPRCALTAPFHPYPRLARQAVCFLWHYPWGHPRRALPGTVSPWSPDFPPARFFNPTSGRPTVWILPPLCADHSSSSTLTLNTDLARISEIAASCAVVAPSRLISTLELTIRSPGPINLAAKSA